MRFLEKLSLAIFSNIVLIMGIIICLLIFGWINLDFVGLVAQSVLLNQVGVKIAFVITIFCMILAIKNIFFDYDSRDILKQKDGILLENSDGKLVISRESLESLVINTVKSFDSAYNINAKILVDKETRKLLVYVTLDVKESASIKELTTTLQSKIKSAIKRTSDLDVKEVNIKVRELEKHTTTLIED